MGGALWTLLWFKAVSVHIGVNVAVHVAVAAFTARAATSISASDPFLRRLLHFIDSICFIL